MAISVSADARQIDKALARDGVRTPPASPGRAHRNARLVRPAVHLRQPHGTTLNDLPELDALKWRIDIKWGDTTAIIAPEGTRPRGEPELLPQLIVRRRWLAQPVRRPALRLGNPAVALDDLRRVLERIAILEARRI